jgi:large subunit ribosomal protein L22
MSQKKNIRKLQDGEAKSITRSIRTSPQKLNIVSQFIVGLPVAQALNQLTFMKKRIAKIVKESLRSAISNAENNHELDIDNLIVSKITVGRGIVMKRFKARARGRGARILKPFSNLEIIVKEKQ